jgi:peptide-methionine (R)-S-oxide reductase
MDIEKRKQELTEEEKHVLFEGGTERPFTGKLLDEHRKGMFACKVCGTPLFSSDAKFESGSGWPSFDQALPGAVEYVEDTSLGMLRTEVRCATCHAHLGHVFDDGPETTGKRYCMNSICMEFKEA